MDGVLERRTVRHGTDVSVLFFVPERCGTPGLVKLTEHAASAGQKKGKV